MNTLSVLKRISQEAVHGICVKQSFNKYSILPRNLSRSDLSSSLVTIALKDSEIEGDHVLALTGMQKNHPYNMCQGTRSYVLITCV